MGGRRGESRNLSWSKLGEKAMSCFKPVPHLTFL